MGPPTGGHLDVIVVPVPSPPSAKRKKRFSIKFPFFHSNDFDEFDFSYYAFIDEKNCRRAEASMNLN